MDALSPRDTARLAELEVVIAAGRKTFDQVGFALTEIRDMRLYKGEFATFQDYCRDRWGWNRAYAYQLINGAAVMKTLPPEMSTIVDNPGQAREVHRIEPTRRVEALQIAQATAIAENRHMTARDIRQAIPPSITIHVNLPPPPSTKPPQRIYPEKWVHADPPRIRTATEEMAEAADNAMPTEPENPVPLDERIEKAWLNFRQTFSAEEWPEVMKWIGGQL